MTTEEIALNYNRYGTVLGQSRERCKAVCNEGSSRDQNSVADIIENMEQYLSSDEPISDSQSAMYRAWRSTIESSGPHSHMFTMCFKRTYPDEQAIAALSDWAVMMNRAIKGPRWRRNKRGLQGVAFAERHSISLDFRGRLHFHVLIKDEGEGLTTEGLTLVARKTALRLRDVRGMQMTDEQRIDLRQVSDPERLAGYLLKQTRSADWQPGDNIAFWKSDSGLDSFQFNKLSASQLRFRH